MTKVAIIGSGPSALMVAEVLSKSQLDITIFEKKSGPAKKLYIAGSSGLNITNAMSLDQFYLQYSGAHKFWQNIIDGFPPEHWLKFIESLGLKTFKGTSHRYFVETMHAAKLIQLWRKRLTDRGIRWNFKHELTDFSTTINQSIKLTFNNARQEEFDAVCFCLGGGSYEPNEKPLRWLKLFKKQHIKLNKFQPSNVGYFIDWPKKFIDECDGQPIKNVILTTKKGSRQGDLMITKYGLEGTPIYTLGFVGTAYIDLKPDLTSDQIFNKCSSIKENLSPIRRLKKQIKMSPAAHAMVYHLAPQNALKDLQTLIQLVKRFPVRLTKPQSIDEAISSSGGIVLSELNHDLMLKKLPGCFAAGEMLDWDAPTGGFLIQACVSMGHYAGHGLLKYLRHRTKP